MPGSNTIADFRKDNRKALKKVFLVFVRACRDMKLVEAETLCLDGTTIRAVNGKKRAVSAEIAKKKLEYAKAQLEAVEKYLRTLDENDLHEKKLNKPMALDLDKDRLPDPEKLKERIHKAGGYPALSACRRSAPVPGERKHPYRGAGAEYDQLLYPA